MASHRKTSLRSWAPKRCRWGRASWSGGAKGASDQPDLKSSLQRRPAADRCLTRIFSPGKCRPGRSPTLELWLVAQGSPQVILALTATTSTLVYDPTQELSTCLDGRPLALAAVSQEQLSREEIASQMGVRTKELEDEGLFGLVYKSRWSLTKLHLQLPLVWWWASVVQPELQNGLEFR